MKKANTAFFENLVITMIFLVILQTFLEDFFVLLGLSWSLRRGLIVSGLVFDLFFSMEFFARMYNALSRGRLKDYIVHDRGWIDFLASIPLLLLNSGPGALTLIFGGTTVLGLAGVLNVLKIVKAVRIARILRLLRVLKVFKQIKYADSPMAQRHISKITAITITTFVSVIFFVNIVSDLASLGDAETKLQDYRSTRVQLIQGSDEPGIRTIADLDDELLIIKRNGSTIYTMFDNDYYRREFGPMDYVYMEEGVYGVFFDMRGLNRIQARESLSYFLIIISLTLVFLLYYSPHFAITLSDPIHVMVRGMKEKHYNLEVKRQERYREDDVFELADAYNEVFLPMKSRQEGESEMEGDLHIDDLDDLFEDL